MSTKTVKKICADCGLLDVKCTCRRLIELHCTESREKSDDEKDVTFFNLMEIVMKDRRPRHFLYNHKPYRYNPIKHLFSKWVEDASHGVQHAFKELSKFAIEGVIPCQQALVTLFVETDHSTIVLEELVRFMDEFDEMPICEYCTSTDLCSCERGRCLACDHFCRAYECCIDIPGAKEAYEATIGAIIPVKMTPTKSMKPVKDTMRNCATVLYDSCALLFNDKERCGLGECTDCDSYECSHCICVICENDVCEHFFIPPPLTPALVVAIKNQKL
jgi:hypothetical protein